MFTCIKYIFIDIMLTYCKSCLCSKWQISRHFYENWGQQSTLEIAPFAYFLLSEWPFSKNVKAPLIFPAKQFATEMKLMKMRRVLCAAGGARGWKTLLHTFKEGKIEWKSCLNDVWMRPGKKESEIKSDVDICALTDNAISVSSARAGRLSEWASERERERDSLTRARRAHCVLGARERTRERAARGWKLINFV